MESGKVKAAAHITGGGLPGNVERVLPTGLVVEIDSLRWTIPPVFGWIASKVCYVSHVCYLSYVCYVSHVCYISHVMLAMYVMLVMYVVLISNCC